MLFSLLYFLVRRLLGAGGRRPEEKDIELLVLRPQVKVLQRQVKRSRLNRLDRVLLAAASRAMSRSSWSWATWRQGFSGANGAWLVCAASIALLGGRESRGLARPRDGCDAPFPLGETRDDVQSPIWSDRSWLSIRPRIRRRPVSRPPADLGATRRADRIGSAR